MRVGGLQGRGLSSVPHEGSGESVMLSLKAQTFAAAYFPFDDQGPQSFTTERHASLDELTHFNEAELKYIGSKLANSVNRNQGALTPLQRDFIAACPQLALCPSGPVKGSVCGLSVLATALKYDQLNTVDTILNAWDQQKQAPDISSELNQRDDIDRLPLQYAVESHTPRYVAWMLQNRADPNGRDHRGDPVFNPLLAEEPSAKTREILQSFRQHRVDFNMRDSEGTTPLCKFIFQIKPQVVKQLLEGGADPNLQSHNISPLQSLFYLKGAAKHLEKINEIRELLICAGAVSE